MHLLPLLLLLLLPFSSAHPSLLRSAADGLLHSFKPLEIHLLRPQTGSAGAAAKPEGLSCSSWQLAVETNNLRGWKTVPAACESYFGHYLVGRRYRDDSAVVISEAIAYARGLHLSAAGNESWVFDIDETTLSNLPYYSDHGFGVEPYNATSFDEWVATGEAPALPESLKLYRELLSLGIKPVFLTGRKERFRDITVFNLKRAGYGSWEKLILKRDGEAGNALQYKSNQRLQLTQLGYKIVGNIGDQWSDILGSPEGERTFKLPDPLYYIS